VPTCQVVRQGKAHLHLSRRVGAQVGLEEGRLGEVFAQGHTGGHGFGDGHLIFCLFGFLGAD